MDRLTTQYRASVIATKARYLSTTRNARATQAALLEQIIASNRDSVFAREHQFESVCSPQSYARTVPIRTYHDLLPWIEKEAAGTRGTLTTDPPIVFHRTSSTTGVAKKIPLTRPGAMVRFANIRAHRASLLEHHAEVVETGDAALILTVSPPVKTVTTGGTPWCFISETEWRRLGIPRHPGAPGARAPWARFRPDIVDWQYYRLVMALESPLRAIMSWFPASILQLERVLTERSEQIIKDIREGTVLDVPVRAPNPARAREIEQAFGRPQCQPLRAVWPALSVVECWKTATSGLYLESLQRCLGADVDIFPCGYGCTESPIALPLGRESGCLLDVTCAFFEFVDADTAGAEDVTLYPHQLERGRDYAIVLTTMSGLYRYALGDVVRVLDFVDDVPIVEFRCRQNVAASLVAEKITEPQIVAVVGELTEKGGIGGFEASLCPVYSATPHYILAVDGPAHLDTDTVVRLSVLLDDSLRQNINYSFYRSNGLVGQACIEVLAPGTFAVRRAGARQRRDAALPQQKHRTVIDQRELEQLRRTSEAIRTLQPLN